MSSRIPNDAQKSCTMSNKHAAICHTLSKLFAVDRSIPAKAETSVTTPERSVSLQWRIQDSEGAEGRWRHAVRLAGEGVRRAIFCRLPAAAGSCCGSFGRGTDMTAGGSSPRLCAKRKLETLNGAGSCGMLHGPRVWSKMNLTVHRLRRKASSDQAVGRCSESGWGTRIRT